MSRWCDLHRPSSPTTVTVRSGFSPVIQFSKEEIIEVCGRLAIAHRSLARCGDQAAARELGVVFVLLERRVAVSGRRFRPPG